MGNRWDHVQAVAAQAARISHVLPEPERAHLVAAAWLHDIGYGPAVRVTGFHPLDGARYLATAGIDGDIVSLVAYHSGARYEAEERNLAEQLATIDPPADAALLDALTYADMTTGPQGQLVAAADRIAEILSRYGPDDPVHRAVTRSRADLLAAVKRTEDRLAAVEDSPEVGRRAVL
jgi:hypothetical protein